MKRIKQKQENPDMVIGFWRHYFDIDKSVFYPPTASVKESAMASTLPMAISGS